MFRTHRFMPQMLSIVASVAIASPLAGQRARNTPTPAGWLTRSTNSDRQLNDARFTPADHVITDANFLFGEGLIRKISGYANPQGFELLPWWSYPVPAVHDRNRLKEYSLDFTVFVPSRRANPDGSGGFGIFFNPSFTSIADVSVAEEENGGRLYLERERGTPVHGATITYSVFDAQDVETFRVLFTSGDQMPFLPVTREEFLRAQIFTLEGKDQENVKKTRAAYVKTPYETWMEGAAERKKNREMTIAMMHLDKAAADKMRDQMEKQERDMTEAYKKDEPTFRTMAADVRNAPSPGDAPRAIMVIMSNLPEVAMGAQRQLYRELDWAALKGRLDKRP